MITEKNKNDSTVPAASAIANASTDMITFSKSKFHLVEWSFVRRHKKEWECRYVLASLIIAVSVMFTGVCVTFYPAFLQ